MGKPDWLLRVEDEQQQLADRLSRLEQFVSSKLFANLSTEEQSELWEQLFAMRRYNRVLLRRLKRYSTP